MINKVASTFQVDVRLKCLINCTLSPICDSYNYRAADKTCQLNTHDTQHTLDSCVHTGSGLVLLIRRASSTLTTLRSLPTRPTLSPTAPGAGSALSSLKSFKLETRHTHRVKTRHTHSVTTRHAFRVTCRINHTRHHCTCYVLFTPV